MAAAPETLAQAPPQTLTPDPSPPQPRVSAPDLTAAMADPAELDLMDLGFSPLMSPAEEAAEDTPIPFTVGDFVWAKIKHHPWWPGRVYDPSQASERARNAHRKDHCLLVTFYGDDSFAWCEPSQLKHFTAAEFPEMSKQNAAKNFVVAVADFADSIGLRLESELACHCIPEEARAGLEPDVPVSANSPFSFTTEEFLERLHTAACDALSVDMLDAAKVRGWGLAFGKGDFSSGSFAYHPQLEIGELVDKIDMDALSLDLFGEELDHDELRSPEDRVVKDPDVSEKKPYRTRKGRSATKLVTGFDFSDIEVSGGEEKAASKSKKGKKENVVEAVDGPGSGRRGRKTPKIVSDDEEKVASKGKKSKQENAAEPVDVSGSGRRGRRVSKHVNEDEEKTTSKSMESKQENATEAVDGPGSRRRGRKKSDNVSDGEVKVESKSKTSKKENAVEAVDGSGSGRPERNASKKENASEAVVGSGSGSGRPERKKNNPVSGDEEKVTPKSKSKKSKRGNAADLVDDSAAGRRERKKSKYLSPPYTVAIGPDQLPDSPTSTESETPKKATGSLRPKSPRISKSVSSVFQEDDDADVDDNDNDNDEDSKSPVYKIDSTSATDILSLFLAAAINPLNLKRHGSSRTVRDFFTVYRSAMYCSDSEFEDYKKYLDAGTNQDMPKDGKMDGRKGKKGGAKEESTPRAGLTATDNSEQTKAEQTKAGLKGRLLLSPEGELEVSCTGDGVWFVESFADCTLEDVNFLELPLMIADDEILPYPRPAVEQEDAAMVLIQVTEFRCGGFTVVCAMNHAVLDGSGQIQFLNSIGEIARGIDKLSVTPIWSRDSIPLPLKTPTLQQLDLSIPKSWTYNSSTIIDVSEATINQLMSQSPNCTSFQLLGALLWQCWTQESNRDPDLPVELWFPVSLRPLLLHHLPGSGSGYYGNCVYSAVARAPAGTVATTSVRRIVDLIREAKVRVPSEFLNWIKGGPVVDPRLRIVGEALMVTDWRGLGFGEIDFGWGRATNWGPATLGGSSQYNFSSCIIVHSPPTVPGGARLVITRGAIAKDKLEAYLVQIRHMKCIASSL